MCRVYCNVAHRKPLLSTDVFADLLHLSKQGGPDSTLLWRNEQCSMGFNRLAIIDTTEKAAQPIITPSERYVLMINGEVYNYKKLQSMYGISDRLLRSMSDAEVISHLIEKMEVVKLLSLIDGMFAIIIYDTKEHILYFARDFAGIKPLYYSNTSAGLIVASQFDQVFKHPWIKNGLKLDYGSLRDYLQLGYMQAPETIFQQIRQVLPGELVQINTITFEEKHFQYYTAFCTSESENVSETSPLAAARFEDVFNDVIKEQIVSDVPLGTFLSGGIDSPLVTAFVARHQQDITSFTIGVNDVRYNEAELAKKYAMHLSIPNVIKYFTEEELLAANNQHFAAYSEPYGDYSSLPTYLLCKYASQQYKVMLSGDGADELFWGYPRFLTSVDNLYWFRTPKCVRRLGGGVMRKMGWKIPYGILSDSFAEWVLSQHSHNKAESINEFFPNSVVSTCVAHQYSFDCQTKQDALQCLRRNEFYAHLQRCLLKVDRASMANGLEVRVPFLSKKIIEFSQTISPQLGISHRTPKLILREVMNKYYPEQIITSQKMGFSVPIDTWLRGPLKEEVLELLLSPTIYGAEGFDRSAYKAYIEQYYAGLHKSDWGIWILYALQKWHSLFLQ